MAVKFVKEVEEETAINLLPLLCMPRMTQTDKQETHKLDCDCGLSFIDFSTIGTNVLLYLLLD